MAAVKAVILTAFRPTPSRQRIFDFWRLWWASTGIPIFACDAGEPWSKARSINLASECASEWDVAMIADADAIVPLDQLQRCLSFVTRTGVAAWPFTRYRRLTAEGTEEVLAGRTLSESITIRPFKTDDGGLVIVPRRVWDSFGGLDPRFVGWGGEDNMLAVACRTMGGRMERTKGLGYHLWHEPARRWDDPAWPAVQTLRQRYRAVDGKPAAFLALRAESEYPVQPASAGERALGRTDAEAP